MVVPALPDAGGGPVGGRREVPDVVGLGPGDVPVADAAVRVVRDAPAADNLNFYLSFIYVLFLIFNLVESTPVMAFTLQPLGITSPCSPDLGAWFMFFDF